MKTTRRFHQCGSLLLVCSLACYADAKTSALLDSNIGALVALKSSLVLNAYIMRQSNKLDALISASSERCFNSSYHSNVLSKDVSYFLSSSMLGERFKAENCAFSGQRFYAWQDSVELLRMHNITTPFFVSDGRLELCQNCQEPSQSNIRVHWQSDMRVNGHQLRFSLGDENAPFVVEESALGFGHYIVNIQGSFSYDLKTDKDCAFSVKNVQTLQDLAFYGDSFVDWQAVKAPMQKIAEGRILLTFDSGTQYVIWTDAGGVLQVNGDTVDLTKVNSLEKRCILF